MCFLLYHASIPTHIGECARVHKLQGLGKRLYGFSCVNNRVLVQCKLRETTLFRKSQYPALCPQLAISDHFYFL